MLKAVIDTVIGNLQLSISNVHIRWVIGLQDCNTWVRNWRPQFLISKVHISWAGWLSEQAC